MSRAALRSVNDDANALCYVWLTFAMLIISIVCFATASHDNGLVYAGIFFITASAVTAVCYLLRFAFTKTESCCRDCLEACVCGGCCRQCVRVVLCLPPPDTTPTMASTRRHRMDAAPGVNATTDGSEHTAVVTSTGHVILMPVNDSTEARLLALEQEITRLRRDYELLERQECVDELVQQDYEQLATEHARLVQWTQHAVTPTPLELKAMKGRLKRVARNFRLARGRIYSHRGISADMHNTLALDVDMDAPEQVRVFSQQLPVPPQYSELDPQPTSTKIYSEQNPSSQSPYVIEQNSASQSPYVIEQNSASQSPYVIEQNSAPQRPYVIPVSEPTSRTGTPAPSSGGLLRSAFVPSVSGAYQNPGFVGALTDSGSVVAPPGYDVGLPPSYQEATASPI